MCSYFLFNFTLLSVCTCIVCQINAEFHPEPLKWCWACIAHENGKDIVTRTETPRKRMRAKDEKETKKHGNSGTERKIMHSTVFFWRVHTLKGESNKWCYGKHVQSVVRGDTAQKVCYKSVWSISMGDMEVGGINGIVRQYSGPFPDTSSNASEKYHSKTRNSERFCGLCAFVV